MPSSESERSGCLEAILSEEVGNFRVDSDHSIQVLRHLEVVMIISRCFLSLKTRPKLPYAPGEYSHEAGSS